MTQPIRIVLAVTIAESLKFLGPLPKMLSSAGWDVHLVSNPGQVAQDINTRGVSIHALPMDRKPSIAQDLPALFLWFKLLRRIRPTIVSIGTPKASLLGIFAAWFLRVPQRVYVLRGLRLETTRGPSRLLLWLLERVTAECATHVLAVSHSLAAKYLELGLCDSDKITVLGSGSSHGVDLKRFSPKPPREVEAKRKELGLSPGVPVLGFVGRFSRDKGTRAILETRKKLVERGIDHEILILGPVEDSQTILDEMNTLGRRAKHVGEVSNVEDFYPLMALLLLPTKREGFPNVVLEAGAAEVPAVTTTATGAVDSVVHGTTGLLVPQDSDDQFAETVADLIQATQELASLGLAARKRIVEEFDESYVTKNILNFYQEIARVGKATGGTFRS